MDDGGHEDAEGGEGHETGGERRGPEQSAGGEQYGVGHDGEQEHNDDVDDKEHHGHSTAADDGTIGHSQQQ